MNIKSLLLGSAAAFVAVSGARAADAVVMVEPEPAEYVRICDTYGTGFFYIPGTETCLKVGGYVRMRVVAQDNIGNGDVDLDSLNSLNGGIGTFSQISVDGDGNPVIGRVGVAGFGDSVAATGGGFIATGSGVVPGSINDDPTIGFEGLVTDDVNGNNNGAGGNVGGIFNRGFSNDDYRVRSRVRARVEFDAREETELGMLRSFIRLQATNNPGNGGGTIDDGVAIDQAYIQLGGLTIGKLDSLWAERDGLFTDNDWSLGDFTQNRVSYTFAVAGFTAAVSVEDDGSGDFVPDVVGQLAYEGGWGEAYVSGVYDEQSSFTTGRFATGNGTATNVAFPTQYANIFTTLDDPRTAVLNDAAALLLYNGDLNDADDGAFALKAGVTLKDLIATGSQLKIEGNYAFDPTLYTQDTGGNYIAPGGAFSVPGVFTNGLGQTRFVDSNRRQAYNLSTEWQVGAGYQQQFDKLFAAVSGVYGETFDLKNSVQSFTAGGTPSGVRTYNLGNAEYWGVAGNVGYAVTSNFSVLGEVSYREVDLPSSLGEDLDTTAGFVEFKRTF